MDHSTSPDTADVNETDFYRERSNTWPTVRVETSTCLDKSSISPVNSSNTSTLLPITESNECLGTTETSTDGPSCSKKVFVKFIYIHHLNICNVHTGAYLDGRGNLPLKC